MIIDSQLHVWELDRPGRPWPPDRPVPAWAHEPMTPDWLLREMDGAGVDRAVLIPPSFEGNRTDLAVRAARQHPERFGVMARLPIDEPEPCAALAFWRDQPGVLGIRMTIFTPDEVRQFEAGMAERIWPAAARREIPIMIYLLPRLLPLVGDIARRYPNLKLIIDHLGVPAHEPWAHDDRAFGHLDALISLSSHSNIGVKASGLARISTEGYPYVNIHPYVERVVGAFGAGRVFWGSDHTRSFCTYPQEVTLFTQHMPWLRGNDLALVMGLAISRWLPWRVEGNATG